MVVTSLFDVVNLSRIAREKIQVLYQGKPIESLWVIRVLLQNRGNYDIDKDMVREPPKISLGSFVLPIDVEPVYVDKESRILTRVEEEKYVTFQIEYLRRKKQAAFQVLAHTDKGFAIRPSKIVLNRGIIENTNVTLVNLLAGGVPHTVEKFFEYLRKNRKLLMWTYVVIGVCMFLVGLIILVYPNVITLFGGHYPSTGKAPVPSIFLIAYGILLLLPSIYFLRRRRYFEVFDKRAKK